MANTSFNFGSLATTPTSNGSQFLKPYDIYENVTVDSVEVKSGTSAKGNDWKCVKITFKCDKGIYSESIFYPKEGDNERREIEMPNGGKRYMCSNFEVTMAMIAAIGNAFNPEGFKKMQEMSSKFKSFDDVVNALKTILSKSGTTSMKLIGKENDGKVYARLPQPLGITQNKESGEWYTFPVAIFGNNLSFSSYEMKKKNEYENAKPTHMKSETTDDLKIDTAEEEFDLNSLL